MGCFLGCFGSSKDETRRKQRKNKVLPRNQQRHLKQNPLQHTFSPERAILTKPTNLDAESGEKPEEQLSLVKLTNLDAELGEKPEEQLSLSARKKVTFDTNVQTYEPVAVDESIEILSEFVNVGEKAKEKNLAESSQSSLLTRDDSITSSVGSYPPNHRYQNYVYSDDEGDELDNEDSDLEDEDDDDYYDEVEDDRTLGGREVWSESIRASLEEVESPLLMSDLQLRTKGLKQNARDRSVYVHPVLNPVENLAQWKAAKSKGTQSSMPYKENYAADQEAPCISFSSQPSPKPSYLSKNSNEDIAVNASLSNWLVSSETPPNQKTNCIGFETSAEKNMPQGSNSATSLEDRPILGALTLEELKQFSPSPSPRKSPSRSPDEMPIIGTVGAYWSNTGSGKDSGSTSSYKGIPNTTSKYREVY